MVSAIYDSIIGKRKCFFLLFQKLDEHLSNTYVHITCSPSLHIGNSHIDFKQKTKKLPFIHREKR